MKMKLSRDRVLGLVLVVLCGVAMSAGKRSESSAVRTGRQAYDEAVKRARADYDKAVKAAADQFSEVLRQEMNRATQAGDLDRALAYRTEKEAMGAGATPNDAAMAVYTVDYGKVQRWYSVVGRRTFRVDLRASVIEGRVRVVNNKMVVLWQDDTADVVRIAGNMIEVDQYHPARLLQSGGEPLRATGVLLGASSGQR